MNGVSQMWKISVACCLALWLPAAGAQTYPAKPVRIVVPFPPGGGADFFARTVADRLTVSLGRQVVVDNRTGAGGTIGSEAVARAAPDGYTLLLTTPDSLTISPRLAGKATYDALRDFAPIIMIASTPNIMVAHPSLPARGVKELIALAKSRPGELNFASNGVGTLSHLTGELFRVQTGLKIVHVPYNGGPPAVIGVVTGEASLLFTAFPTAITQVRAGKLRPLAVGSAKRAGIAPDIPSVAETLPGFESNQWYGLFAPSATAAAIVERVNGETARVLADQTVRKQFLDSSAEPMGGAPADLAQALRADYEKWGAVMTKAGLR